MTHQTTIVAALSAALALSAGSSADHIPGHQNGDPTFPMPIPGQNDFSGGIAFVTLIGPPPDSA